MKRKILVIGMLVLLVLGGENLLAQRSGRGQQGNKQKGRKEVKDDRGRKVNDRNRNGNRTVRVVNRRSISYDGYRGGSYYRFASQRDFGSRQFSRRPYQPSRRHIWIGGHWKYNRRFDREVWVDGYWTVRQKHHRYVDGHYTRRGGARIWIPACWVSF